MCPVSHAFGSDGSLFREAFIKQDEALPLHAPNKLEPDKGTNQPTLAFLKLLVGAEAN